MDDTRWIQRLVEQHQETAYEFELGRRDLAEFLQEAALAWTDTAGVFVRRRFLEPMEDERAGFVAQWRAAVVEFQGASALMEAGAAPEHLVNELSQQQQTERGRVEGELDNAARAADSALSLRAAAAEQAAGSARWVAAAGAP